MGNFYSPPDLINNLTNKKRNCSGTVKQNMKGMLWDLGQKNVRLKQDDSLVRTRGDITALIWKKKRMSTCWLTCTIHQQKEPAMIRMEMLRSQLQWNITTNMWVMTTQETMSNNYTISHCIQNYLKRLFFHQLNITIFNSYFLSSSCGKKTSSYRISPVFSKRHANTCRKRNTALKNTWKTRTCCYPSGQIGYQQQ